MPEDYCSELVLTDRAKVQRGYPMKDVLSGPKDKLVRSLDLLLLPWTIPRYNKVLHS